MNLMKKFFELNKPYQFDINDVVALIYVVCAVMGICGMNATPLFLLGSIIGFITSLSAHRINLLLINGAFIALNAVNIFKLFF